MVVDAACAPILNALSLSTLTSTHGGSSSITARSSSGSSGSSSPAEHALDDVGG